MPNKQPLLKLSRDEELFLRHWMYDETHYQAGAGPAKLLQRMHRAVPADLAVLIAAGFPDLQTQAKASEGPPPSQLPVWPWREQSLADRLLEARAVLGLPTESISSRSAQP